MLQKMFGTRISGKQILIVFVIMFGSVFLAWPSAARALFQEALASEQLNINPFINFLALALVIERLLEIGITFFPGLEEKKLALLKDDEKLAALQLKVSRVTMLIGMGLGVLACIIFKFGVLDEIFPGRHLALNVFNFLITGIIAGAGADPVHQLVLILASVKQRLQTSRQVYR